MKKIQALLVEYLSKHGQIKLILPDGVILEIGITQEEQGELVKKEDYCWIIASRKDRIACLDSYNLGVRFNDEKDILILDDSFLNQDGENIRRLDII